MKRHIVSLISVVLFAGLLSACAHNLSPKVTIDVADRTAYAALRVVDVDEETLYHQKGAWPTPAQHVDISKKLSQGYGLIIDVANIGLAVPPAGKLSTADLAKVTQLGGLVADLVSLASPATGAKIQTDIQTFVSKANALINAVKGLGAAVPGSAFLRNLLHNEIHAAATARRSPKGR